jgi:protein gp37
VLERRRKMTDIEWVLNPDGSQGYTSNPITGCLNHVNGLCKGGSFPCYAYKLAHGRLKGRYVGNNEYAPVPSADYFDLNPYIPDDPFCPRFWEEKVNEIWKLGRSRCTKAKGIFLCDMSDLFGIGVPEKWTRAILDAVSHAKPHRFYLLTKQPQRLPEFSPFPENAWVGVTATDAKMADDAGYYLQQIDATVRFLSLEPLLEPMQLFFSPLVFNRLDLVIIGACTGTWVDMANLCMKHTNSLSNYAGLTLTQWGNKWTAQPRIEWVREIVEAAGKAGVKVFLKNNLRPLLIPEDCSKPNYLTEDIFWASDKAKLRQEMPNGA